MTLSSASTRPPIVDSHQHVWDPATRFQPWLDSDSALASLRRKFAIADLEPHALAAGVTATVVVQTVTEPTETPELLALANTEPLIAAVVGWTDLTSPVVEEEIVGLTAGPGGRFLTAIRHPLLTEPDRDWLARPDVRRGLSALGDAGLCFDLVLRPDQLPSAVAVAAALPELTFVLDHLGNVVVEPDVDADWAAAFTAFAALPNTVCKVSGILGEASPVMIRPYFDLALGCYGADRLMFGSDWPVCTLTASYSTVVANVIELTGSLSQSERQAILADTASRVYCINRAAPGG